MASMYRSIINSSHKVRLDLQGWGGGGKVRLDLQGEGYPPIHVFWMGCTTEACSDSRTQFSIPYCISDKTTEIDTSISNKIKLT